jgi:hypothetical protein
LFRAAEERNDSREPWLVSPAWIGLLRAVEHARTHNVPVSAPRPFDYSFMHGLLMMRRGKGIPSRSIIDVTAVLSRTLAAAAAPCMVGVLSGETHACMAPTILLVPLPRGVVWCGVCAGLTRVRTSP